MELELLNHINLNMNWNILRKVRTSMTKRPRKPGAAASELLYNVKEPAAFETKKSGKLKVADPPLKKRRLVHQFPSPPPQNLCINGEEGLSPGPQTPSVHHEDSGQRCRSSPLTQSQKTKSKTGSRNSKQLRPIRKEVFNLDDFSGIELLAAAACSTFIHDNAYHVDDFSTLKEKTTPGVNASTVDIKEEAIVSRESTGLSVQDDMVPNGNEEVEKKVAPSKELRLHWDLNTVMDEWTEPSDESPVKPYDDAGVVVVEERSMLDSVDENQISVKHDAAISIVPLVEKCNLVGKPYVLTEDLTCAQEDVGTKMITSKTSDFEISVSKSDGVDLLIHSVKCEDVSTSTTSVLQEEIIVKGDSDTNTMSKFDQPPVSEEVMQDGSRSPKSCKSYCDNEVTTEDPVSECCGSNVTQDEQGHMAEGDSEDKLQVGYDSPFEDGELREPIEKVMCYESDSVYKDDFGSIENPVSEKVEPFPDHCQTMGYQSSLLVKETTPNNDIKQGAKVDTLKKPHIDETGRDLCESKEGHDDESRSVGGNLLHIDALTSFDVCKMGEYIRQNRSSNNGDCYSRAGRDLGGVFVDSSLRVWDLKSQRNSDSSHSRNYNPRDGYWTQNRRQSPSERNNGYGTTRGPPARSHSRDRYRGGSGFHLQEYHDHKSCYLERKPRFSPNFSRPRSRSRSGSPIAWHFQKRKNLDNTINYGETKAITRAHVSPELSSKCSDDRRLRDCPFRDKRQSPVKTMQRNERFEPIGYPERLKSDDHFRFTQRPARFSQIAGHRYKDGSDTYRKHDDHYVKTNRAGCTDDDGGMRRFRVIPEGKNLGERY